MNYSQEDFVTGQRECPITDKEYSDIMIVGGFNGGSYSSDVEVVAIDGDPACSKPADYPSPLDGMVGTYMGEKVLVCGGEYTSDCFSYDFADKIWLPHGSTLVQRAFAGAVMLNESHWWITGGFNNQNNMHVFTTELYNVATNSFSPFLDLPKETGNHIVLKLDETHFFLCCGEEMNGNAYILDLETEAWMPTPIKSQFDHERGFAGQ